jgi:branched-chain amino acid transport system substrate-binding protein
MGNAEIVTSGSLTGSRARHGWRSGRSWPAWLAVAACAALLVACGSSGSGSSSNSGSSAHTPIKVGYLLPLTGVFTKNGLSEQDGFKLGLQRFGTSVDGHPIQVTYANDQGEPAVSLSQARQLVTGQHVQVVEGPLLSSAIAVVAPYVLGQGIPEDDLYLASPEQAQAYTKYGTGFTSGWDGFAPTTVGGRWAYDAMHWRHVTMVGLGISFGWQGVAGFAEQFTKLGGKIDKEIWVPSNTVDMSSYVPGIPARTQAVFVVLSGSQAANFVNDYASFGLKKKIPLMGITTLTDQAALPAENTPAALKSLHGVVSSEKALSAAMRAVHITAPRGPVSFDHCTWSPVQNEYICKVENVHGTLRNVPVLTFAAVPPWGTLSKTEWQPIFAKTAVSPPSY